MNQFQVQLMNHLHKIKKDSMKNISIDNGNNNNLQYYNNTNNNNNSENNNRKRSCTQTSQNSISTNPFTQLESSQQYDPKGQILSYQQDYIPELSRESSIQKQNKNQKRHTVELEPSKLNQLINPQPIHQSINLNESNNNNILDSNNNNNINNNLRSLSTDFSSIKKNRNQSQSLNYLLQQKILQQSSSSYLSEYNNNNNNLQINTPRNKNNSKSDKVISRLMRFESFYNFPQLYDKEETESRRRSQEYSQVFQERHELWRNRSHSENQQKFVHSVIENGKKNYQKVKHIYSSSQSRLRFKSDKEQFSKDVYNRVYGDCKNKCKDIDSIIKSSSSFCKSSSSLQQHQSIIHPTFPSHVKQTDVQLKQLNKEFQSNYNNAMNQITLNQSVQRIAMNNKFSELEESMRYSQSEKLGSDFFNSNQKILTNSNFKQQQQQHHIHNFETPYQERISDVSSFQSNQQNLQPAQIAQDAQHAQNNINEQQLILDNEQKLITSQKLQNSQTFNINSPAILNSDYFDLLNSYSTKSQKNNSQGSTGCKPLIYSAEKYMNQCNSLVRLESDLKKYKELCHNQQQQLSSSSKKSLQTNNNNNNNNNNNSNKIKSTKKEYLQGKCRHNLSTMYCSICNRQVKSQI